jgi:hypothetical protein
MRSPASAARISALPSERDAVKLRAQRRRARLVRRSVVFVACFFLGIAAALAIAAAFGMFDPAGAP